jgi:hypothetical protein
MQVILVYAAIAVFNLLAAATVAVTSPFVVSYIGSYADLSIPAIAIPYELVGFLNFFVSTLVIYNCLYALQVAYTVAFSLKVTKYLRSLI